MISFDIRPRSVLLFPLSCVNLLFLFTLEIEPLIYRQLVVDAVSYGN